MENESKQPRWSRLVIGAEPMSPEEEAGYGDSQIKPQPQKQEPDFQQLAQIVSDHLGIPPFQFEVKELENHYKGKYYQIQSPPMNEHTGVFQHALETVVIGSFNSSWNTDKETKQEYYWLTLSLQYNHWSGGSNGAQLATCWWKDGQWDVEWTRDRALEQHQTPSTRL